MQETQTPVAYQESDDSTVTHYGELYSVNKLLDLSASKPMVDCTISKLMWLFKEEPLRVDMERVDACNTVYPLIVTVGLDERLIVLDGLHRLLKAHLNKRTKVKVRYLTTEEVAETKVRI